MNVLAAVSAQLDLWLDRFEARFVETDEDAAGVARVLEEVRDKELNRVSAPGYATYGLEDSVPRVRMAACVERKTGRVIGCMRVTPAASLMGLEGSVGEYRLDQFPAPLLERLLIFSRLCVLKEYRKTVASFVMLSRIFAGLVAERYDAALLTCEPYLLGMYTRLGAKAIGRAHNTSGGGWRLPMICIPDVAHLEAVGSPLLRTLKKVDPSRAAPFVAWHRGLVAREGEIPLGVARYDPEDDAPCHRLLTEGLSERGSAQLLEGALVVSCNVGDLVVAERDGGKAICFVKAGLVDVSVGGVKVGMLGAGQMFGEVAVALDGLRTATVVASVPGTEVLLLSPSALSRLGSADDRAQVWRNVARAIAGTLAMRSPG